LQQEPHAAQWLKRLKWQIFKNPPRRQYAPFACFFSKFGTKPDWNPEAPPNGQDTRKRLISLEFHPVLSHVGPENPTFRGPPLFLLHSVSGHLAVGLSPSPCWGRIKKMEEAGVIEGYTVRINPQALGLADTVLVQVTLDSHSDNTLEKFGETLASIPEVIEAHLVSGDYDYLLRVVVKDTRDYERLLREKLYKIKGIRHSRSSFVLRTLKKADLPLNIS
jgi:Lrp/AsnC family leucine-responsive transcriptional regulator